MIELSLNLRLLLAVSAALFAFLGLTGAALDRAFQSSAQTAAYNRLHGQLLGLLAAAELEPGGGLQVPAELPEPRFARPGSGLYAQVASSTSELVWQSESLLDRSLPSAAPLAAGTASYERRALSDGEPVFWYRVSTIWEGTDNTRHSYEFSVAEDMGGFRSEVAAFRRTLWAWLLAAAVLLLLVQGLVLRWSLRPLRRVAREVSLVEAGDRERISEDYPRELRPLTDNLNAMLRNEMQQRQRYRDTLADLAHSLKTPLAVLQGLSDNAEQDRVDGSEVRGQVLRMQDIVQYQLQRASAGQATFVQPVPVAEQLDKLLAALDKVYREKQLAKQLSVPEDVMFYGDRGDLLEVLGNLLDNAYKYGRGRVGVTASAVTSPRHRRPGLAVKIEDDGPGIADAVREKVLQRGERADSRVEGQGLGLAVVMDIMAAYGGQLMLALGTDGGAQVTVTFPPS